MRSRCSLGHLQRFVDGFAETVHIIRVDDESFRQFARSAGKVRQHEHALFVVSCRDKLLGNEIHAVVKAADDADIGCAEQPEDLVRLVMADDKPDRLVPVAAVLQVDGLRQADRFLLQVAVAIELAARRCRGLNEDKLSQPFGMRDSSSSIARMRLSTPFV